MGGESQRIPQERVERLLPIPEAHYSLLHSENHKEFLKRGLKVSSTLMVTTASVAPKSNHKEFLKRGLKVVHMFPMSAFPIHRNHKEFLKRGLKVSLPGTLKHEQHVLNHKEFLKRGLKDHQYGKQT